MANPWEEYQQVEEEQSSGAEPWNDPKFTGIILDERHPDVSISDRFIIKNLNAQPEQQKQYLQTRYPDLDVEVQAPSNEIIVKRKDETAWRKLDPDRLEWEDVTDVVPDVAQAAGETAAAIGGGVLGAKTGRPLAALAGGAAGAGVVGGGANLLRQKLRQYLGLQEGLQPGELALETGIPAASVPLMGTGGEAVKGLTKSQVAAQRGILSRGAEGTKEALIKTYPRLAEWLTLGSMPKEATETYMDRAKRAEVESMMGEGAAPVEKGVKQLEVPKIKQENLVQFAQEEAQKAQKEFYDYKNEIGGQIGSLLDRTKTPTNIGKAKQVIVDYINEMSRRSDASSVKVQEMIDVARQLLDGPNSPFAESYPIVDKEEIIARALEKATPDQAAQILKLRKPGTLKETQVRDAYKVAKQLFPEGFVEVQSVPDNVTARMAHTIRKTIEDESDALRKTPGKDYVARYGKNATWEKKVLTDLYSKMSREINNGLKKSIGKPFAEYNHLYKKIYETEKALSENIGDEEQFIKTMQDFYTDKSPGMAVFRSIHQDIKRKTGGHFDLEPAAKTLTTVKYMDKPPIITNLGIPQLGLGTIGAGIGKVSEMGYAPGFLMAAAGAAATSPRATKLAIQGAHLLQKAGQLPGPKQLRQYKTPLSFSAWQGLSASDKKALEDYFKSEE